jgi:hypothetical protein
MGAGLALVAWALAHGIPAAAEPGPPPDLEVDPTSVVEGHDAHITVSGAGCVGGDEAARVAIHFIHHSRMPPELTVVVRYPRPVTDPAGAWSSEIVVPSAGLLPRVPERRHSVTATCFLGTGEAEQSFDYEDVPFVVTEAPDTSTTTEPPTPPTTATTVAPPTTATPQAPPAVPIVARPNFTG